MVRGVIGSGLMDTASPLRYPTCSCLILLPGLTHGNAGDRFREVYYWDTYWVIRGLLASGLIEAAADAVRNLLHCVRRFGFVPNGSRAYYLNRSQPPLLSAMVAEVWKAMGGGDGIATGTQLW